MNRLQFVIHSTGDGQVGCSQARVIIDNAAVTKFLCISYHTCLSLAGSWGICMFNLSGWGFPGDSAPAPSPLATASLSSLSVSLFLLHR